MLTGLAVSAAVVSLTLLIAMWARLQAHRKHIASLRCELQSSQHRISSLVDDIRKLNQRIDTVEAAAMETDFSEDYLDSLLDDAEDDE